jgi:hypothetical protein
MIANKKDKRRTEVQCMAIPFMDAELGLLHNQSGE